MLFEGDSNELAARTDAGFSEQLLNFTAVLNTDKNSDPYCKQGIYDAETGALRLRSRVLS